MTTETLPTEVANVIELSSEPNDNGEIILTVDKPGKYLTLTEISLTVVPAPDKDVKIAAIRQYLGISPWTDVLINTTVSELNEAAEGANLDDIAGKASVEKLNEALLNGVKALPNGTGIAMQCVHQSKYLTVANDLSGFSDETTLGKGAIYRIIPNESDNTVKLESLLANKQVGKSGDNFALVDDGQSVNLAINENTSAAFFYYMDGSTKKCMHLNGNQRKFFNSDGVGSQWLLSVVNLPTKVTVNNGDSNDISSLSLIEGRDATLTATTTREADGDITAAIDGVIWLSSDPTKVTVDANGTVHAVAATEQPVTITARAVGAEKTIEVTVSTLGTAALDAAKAKETALLNALKTAGLIADDNTELAAAITAAAYGTDVTEDNEANATDALSAAHKTIVAAISPDALVSISNGGFNVTYYTPDPSDNYVYAQDADKSGIRSVWQLVPQADGTVYIRNYSEQKYLGPGLAGLKPQSDAQKLNIDYVTAGETSAIVFRRPDGKYFIRHGDNISTGNADNYGEKGLWTLAKVNLPGKISVTANPETVTADAESRAVTLTTTVTVAEGFTGEVPSWLQGVTYTMAKGDAAAEDIEGNSFTVDPAGTEEVTYIVTATSTAVTTLTGNTTVTAEAKPAYTIAFAKGDENVTEASATQGDAEVVITVKVMNGENEVADVTPAITVKKGEKDVTATTVSDKTVTIPTVDAATYTITVAAAESAAYTLTENGSFNVIVEAATVTPEPIEDGEKIAEVTFNRTGANASDVTATVSGIVGATATLVSVKNGETDQALKTSGTSIGNDVLCPDTNVGSQDVTIVMTYEINGIPIGTTLTGLGLDIHALDSNGKNQNKNTVRRFNFTTAVNGTDFASIENIDIASNVVVDSRNHKVWDMTEVTPYKVTGEDPITLTVTVHRGATETQGCFFGLSQINLVGTPVPTVKVESIVGPTEAVAVILGNQTAEDAFEASAEKTATFTVTLANGSKSTLTADDLTIEPTGVTLGTVAISGEASPYTVTVPFTATAVSEDAKISVSAAGVETPTEATITISKPAVAVASIDDATEATVVKGTQQTAKFTATLAAVSAWPEKTDFTVNVSDGITAVVTNVEKADQDWTVTVNYTANVSGTVTLTAGSASGFLTVTANDPAPTTVDVESVNVDKATESVELEAEEGATATLTISGNLTPANATMPDNAVVTITIDKADVLEVPESAQINKVDATEATEEAPATEAALTFSFNATAKKEGTAVVTV
ncbi:MAG: Ig-like domain-containing protein, partial [Alloprevotella sp.]|nr:Ig-like domain-containing protein [Alloprevotella sp.]